MYGVLLPHFGRAATRERLLSAATSADRAGFDVLFARDHLYYQPRPLEHQDSRFLDTFVTLAAAAAVTTRAMLGAAVMNLHRNPIHAAQLWGALDHLAGGERIFPMWGLGAPRTVEAAGMGGWDLPVVLREYMHTVRTLWSGEKMTYQGTYYAVPGVSIDPVPAGAVSCWYGGPSLAAVRRAVETFDGYSAGQMPGRDYRARRRRLIELCESAGRQILPTCLSPIVSPGRTYEDGARHVPIAQLSADFVRKFTVPSSGRYETIADFTGSVIAGAPSDVIGGVRSLQSMGVDMVIFDLRLRFDEWDECVALIGEEVLPALHRDDGRAAGTPPAALLRDGERSEHAHAASG